MKLVLVKIPAFLFLGIVLAALCTKYGFWIQAGTSTLSDPVPWALSGFAVFLAPILWRRYAEAQRSQRWARDSAIAQMQQEHSEEMAHQTALRRERERLEMQMALRVKELLSTLEIQHRLDAQKLHQLQEMKREFAAHQHADLATLLGRLEAMKAGK